MSGKFALIIGNAEYTDPGLAQLSAPGKDAESLARILRNPEFCGFDEVKVSLNQLSSTVSETIDEFFDQKKPDDLLVLYFSGHGIRDEFGSLHLAFKNTIRSRLRSTAIKADYIREAMDQSRSTRQVLILDCCNSGAFPQGTKAEVGGAMGMMTAFQGYGRYVLTASDATQFAWEGDRVIGRTENSLFTHFLVTGLEGEADDDGDGKITVDELYDYAFEQISKVMPQQTPTKSASKQAGEIVLRQITRMEQIKAVSLPEELIDGMEDPRAFVREGAVQQLEEYLKGKNLGLARSAREALEKIAAQDDSYRVRQAAIQVLQVSIQKEQIIEDEGQAKEDTKSTAIREPEEKPLTSTHTKAEPPANAAAQQLRSVHAAEEESVVRARLDAEREARPKRTGLGTEGNIPSRRSPVMLIGIGIIAVLAVLTLYGLGTSQLMPWARSGQSSTPTLQGVSAIVALPTGILASTGTGSTTPATAAAMPSASTLPATITTTPSPSGPEPSAYTTAPPSADGYVRKDEWKNAVPAATLSHGKVYYLNDDKFLYLLVDVVGDNVNDLDSLDRTYDELYAAFDLNNDQRFDTGDAVYMFFGCGDVAGCTAYKDFLKMTKAGSNGCLDAYTGWIRPSLEGARVEAGFGSSPFVVDPHRFYELAINLTQIGGIPGGRVAMDLRYSSKEPDFTDESMPGFKIRRDQNCAMTQEIPLSLGNP